MEPSDEALLTETVGLLQRDKGRADQIATDLVFRYPNEPRAHVAYAASRSLLQDYPAAVHHLDIAASLADSALIQFNLGYCHRQCGDYERAVSHFARGLAMAGADESLRVLAANTLDVLGRREEAMRHLGEAGRAGAPDATPISVFCRWLLAPSADTPRVRAYFSANPARIDQAVLFWMKYDCHLFAELDNKARLAKLIDRAIASGAAAMAEFWPKTRIVPEDVAADAGDGEAWWLFKPASLSGGQGMRFARDPTVFDGSVLGIVQHYLHPPFLLLGRKFNLRLLLGILSVDPLRIYLWRDGLVFISPEPYAEPSDPPGIAHVVNLLRARQEAIARPLGPLAAHIVPLSTLLASALLEPQQVERLKSGVLRLAAALKQALEASGFAASLCDFANVHAFPPRFIGLDVGFAPDLSPRLFEIERYPGIGGVSAQSTEINARFRHQWLSFILSNEPEADPHFQPF